MASTHLVRIKRMGDQFATVGIGLGVPPDVSRDSPDYPDIAARAAKLAPGQVVELPADHFLLKPLHKCLERVDGVEQDEVLRPWVFPDMESAIGANPWKSNMTREQVAESLALSAGAVERAAAVAGARERGEEPEDLAPVLARRGRARMQ
jgi:hypothetical protein